MPLPKPKAGEKKDDFIDRCMSNDTMKDEYPDNDQRLAVCFDIWKNKDKKDDNVQPEYRTFEASLELETREEQPTGVITGHAAVFDIIGDGGWFMEKIAPGAFKKTIKKDDVRALFNHDVNYVLGRNKAGTLIMKEDDQGLFVRIFPPDTQYARDLKISIQRGDISQMSFGFEILKESREVGEKGKPSLFTLEEVKLWDVSPVTYPFYKETDVSVHSREAWAEAQRSAFNPPRWRGLDMRRRFEMKEKNLKGGFRDD